MEKKIKDLVDYYCNAESSWGQSDLTELLREIQKMENGILRESVLDDICRELDIKRSYLSAVMKYIPDLKTEKICHRLEVCGGKNCQSNDSAALQRYIEKEYCVKKDGISKKGSFSYKVSGCMKHCRFGPCIRWDGEIHTKVTPEYLDTLIKKKN